MLKAAGIKKRCDWEPIIISIYSIMALMRIIKPYAITVTPSKGGQYVDVD